MKYFFSIALLSVFALQGAAKEHDFLGYKLLHVHDLDLTITQEENQSKLAVIKSKLAKRLACKALVLHKNVEPLYILAKQRGIEVSTVRDAIVTPLSLERRINIAVFYAYPKDPRRPGIVKAITQKILQHYLEAQREFMFLKDCKISEHAYEKNPGHYKAQYDIWLHRQSLL